MAEAQQDGAAGVARCASGRQFVFACCVALAMLVCSHDACAQDATQLKVARQQAREAVTAYRAGNWEAYSNGLKAALSVQPRHPIWLYNAAGAAALRGADADVFALLDTVASFGFAFDAMADDDFSRIRDTREFGLRVARLEANRVRVGGSQPAVALAGADFLPEGIAYDAKDSTIFLSSVHERKIVRIHAGISETLADSTAGLWSVLGIVFAPRTRSLWAVTTVMPEMSGHTPQLKGTALVELDAGTGAVRRRIEPPGEGHAFNDLTVDDSGTVYISDPGSGAIYQWTEDQGLRELVPPGAIYSPSGLVVMPDTEWLYVADYSVGIVRVSRRTGQVERLSEASGVSTYGTDGLIRYGRDLIVIQNALKPHRVARLTLSRDGSHVESLVVLERASPDFDEPTLGVITDDALLYIANSGWSRFRNGRYVGLPDASGPVVLRLHLR